MGMNLTGRRHRRVDELAGVRLRRSEARLSALLADTDDVVALLDIDGRVVFASRAAGRLFGRTVSSALGSVALDLVHPDDHNRVMANIRANRVQPDVSDRVEFRVLHTDGNPRIVEAVLTNKLEEPTVAAFVVTMRDV